VTATVAVTIIDGWINQSIKYYGSEC